MTPRELLDLLDRAGFTVAAVHDAAAAGGWSWLTPRD
jgi:hypothetical protein